MVATIGPECEAKPEDEAQIPNQIGNIRQRLIRLSQVVDELEGRLIPIMLPGPAGDQPCEAADEETSEMTAELKGIRNTIDGKINAIETIISRLEV